MIFFLSLSLLLFTIANFYIGKKEVFNPAFVATGAFFLFSFLGCFANLYIGIDIENGITLIVILIGILIFSIVNCIAGFSTNNVSKFAVEIKYNTVLVLLTIQILLAAIYVNYRFIVEFAGAYGVGGDFFECLVIYKQILTFSDPGTFLVAPPWYRNILVILSNVLVYVHVYIFFRDRIIKKNTHYLCIFLFVLYIIYTLMGGSRSGTFKFITAMLFMWGYWKEKDAEILFNPRKVLFRILSIIAIVAVLFVLFIVAVGRTSYDFDIEYVVASIFVYAAAPIFNLDVYLGNPWSQTHGIWGELTFIRLINWIGKKLKISNYQYELDLPFLSYQNYNLGNVYTTFYAFYYDFGLIGVVVLSLIMIVFASWMFKKTLKNYKNESKRMIIVICYAYVINDLIMLPFSNRWYEMIMDIGVWYNFIALCIVIKSLYWFGEYENKKW